MAPPMKPSREEMLATTFNAKLAKQGAKSRKLAEARDVNTMPDPKTYATVMGLLGERPDEMGFSVAHPKYKEIMDVAEPAFALGTAAQVVPLVKPAGQAVRGAAKALAPKAGQMVMDAAQATGMPVYGLGVVKNEGGNWLGGTMMGNIDRAVKRLTPTGNLSGSIKTMKAELASLENAGANQRTIDLLKADIAAAEKDQAIYNWTTRNLGNYVKKEMGTPSDPVRRLADEGIVHAPHGEFVDPEAPGLASKRSMAGFPIEGMAKSTEAANWEDLSDRAINSIYAGEVQKAVKNTARGEQARKAIDAFEAELPAKFEAYLQRVGDVIDPVTVEKLRASSNSRKADLIGQGDMYRQLISDENFSKLGGKDRVRMLDTAEENPWIEKLPPTERLYSGDVSELGFDHIIDVLREDVRAGRIRPEQLSKVSMEQAVRRTYEYDQEMARKLGSESIKDFDVFPTHKEYPEGYRWIELKKPNQRPEGWETSSTEGMWTDPTGKLVKDPNITRLEQALKFEGESMGHCVGGYCPDVLSGNSRIFSLRDAKGQPHVTVEVNPPHRDRGFIGDQRPRGDEYYALQDQYVNGQRAGEIPQDLTFAEWWRAQNGIPEVDISSLPQSIRQIKGKQNAAPKEAYLPYVQDFVRSGNWSSVGDLFNTGLRDIEKTPHLKKWLQERGIEHPRYLTEKEYGAHEADFLLNKLKPEEGMKDGGEVKATPVKNKAAHGMSQALGAVHKFASEPFGYKNPPGEMISDMLGIPATARTLERMGYGEPLTTGKGMTTKPKADTMDALMAVAPLAPVTKGAPVGAMFIGAKSKRWDQAMADLAQQMEKAGADPVEIWHKTGTFRGKDGHLRQEISDQGTKFLAKSDREDRVEAIEDTIAEMKRKIAPTPQKDLFPKLLNEAKKEVRDDISIMKGSVKNYQRNPNTQGIYAPFIIEHPELYKAYPELNQVLVNTPGGSGSTRGSLSIIPSHGVQPGKIEMDVYNRGLMTDPESTSLHEMQHAIQTIEGWSPGGSPTMAFADPRAHEMLKNRLDELHRPATFDEFQRANRFPEDKAQAAYDEYVRTHKAFINPKVERELQRDVAHEFYRRLAGEAEARATQERMNMSPAERRQHPPAGSYDYPQEDLFTKPPMEYKEGGEVKMDKGGDAKKKVIDEFWKGMKESVPQRSELGPLDMLKQNLSALYEGAQKVPGNLYKMAIDPIGYAKSLPAPTGDQIINAFSPADMGFIGSYRPSTPLKPDPTVGTRYKVTDQGGLVPRQNLDIEQLQGSQAKIFPWDATSRNKLVTEVSEVPLKKPVLTEGGDEYMMDVQHVKNRIAGASNEGIANRILDRIDQAAWENRQLGGTGKVYGFPVRMGEGAEFFSTFPTDIVMDFIGQGALNKKELGALTKDLRTMNFLGKKAPLAGIAPVGTPEFEMQLREGVKKGKNTPAVTPGNLRKGLMNRLGMVEYQQRMGYNLPDLQGAVIAENLKGVPKGYVGNVVAELDPGSKLRPSKSSSYSHDFSGQYAGSMPNQPVEFLMPNTYEVIYREMKKEYPNASETALRNMTIGAMEKRKESISELIGQRSIDAVKTYQEGLKKGEFDPNNIQQVYDYMRRKKLELKLKKGGPVKTKSGLLKVKRKK